MIVRYGHKVCWVCCKLRRTFTIIPYLCYRTMMLYIEFRELPCGLLYKCLTIVIYYRYGKGQYYKTTIIANFALVRSIIYDCKI
jgi:hypothetical protein